MTIKDLQYQLSTTLFRASMKGKYAMTTVADNNGITLQQAMSLCLLEVDKGVRMTTVANYLTCDPSTITGVVERLVSLGFIDRKESRLDRRQKLISLTESGVRLRNELLRVATETRFPALDSLQAEEIQVLIRLINKAADGARLVED